MRRQRSTASRQTSLTPVQEAADGGEGGRPDAAPPVNDGRSQHPQGQVSSCVCMNICMHLYCVKGVLISEAFLLWPP